MKASHVLHWTNLLFWFKHDSVINKISCAGLNQISTTEQAIVNLNESLKLWQVSSPVKKVSWPKMFLRPLPVLSLIIVIINKIQAFRSRPIYSASKCCLHSLDLSSELMKQHVCNNICEKNKDMSLQVKLI